MHKEQTKKVKTQKNIIKLIPILFIWVSSLQLNAQIFKLNPDQEEKTWAFNLSPYGLLASQSTDVGGERIRSSFDDLSSLTNSGFQLIANLRYKRWTFAFDGTWANLGSSQNGNLLNLDLNIDQQILDLRAGYLVVRDLEIINNNVIKGWQLGVNIGGKYWLNDVNLGYQFTILGDVVLEEGSLIEKQEWWDLTVGIAPSFFISKIVTISAQASIGGFGLGESSQLAYDWTFVNSFKVAKPLAIDVGFRNFFYKREDGQGDQKVQTKVNVIGPFLGVSLLIL